MVQPRGTAKPKFAVGDVVRLKPRKLGLVGSALKRTPENQRFNTPRIGTVKDVITKASKGGHTCFYYEILWDNESSQTATHAQMRLALVDGPSV